MSTIQDPLFRSAVRAGQMVAAGLVFLFAVSPLAHAQQQQPTINDAPTVRIQPSQQIRMPDSTRQVILQQRYRIVGTQQVTAPSTTVSPNTADVPVFTITPEANPPDEATSSETTSDGPPSSGTTSNEASSDEASDTGPTLTTLPARQLFIPETTTLRRVHADRLAEMLRQPESLTNTPPTGSPSDDSPSLDASPAQPEDATTTPDDAERDSDDDASVFISEAPWISTGPDGSATQGNLFMRSMQNGFVMGNSPSVFTTTLQVGLANSEQMGEIELASPVQLLVSADDLISIDNSPIRLTHFNRLQTVNIDADPRSDSIRVSVGLPTDSDPASAYLNVRRPALSVLANPTQIDGFGFGTGTIEVRVPSRYPEAVTFSAQGSQAAVEPSSQRIDPGTTGTFTVRSWGVGTETVRFAGGPFAEQNRSVEIRFVWPIYFLLFSVVGSLVGSGIRYSRRVSQASDDPDTPAPKLVGILLSGTLMGLVFAGFYGVGISLLPVLPTGLTGQAAVFLIAAAGGVVGPHFSFEDASAK